ncbi:uncharacterized protein EV420DRAFT_1642373 [Desarmillaria tabescens]|uniref:Uncharacterized protein n=1 Tax=Armillaria tabescens TaxID=1929756 RepID=A0AA39N679_ARMTA|nr:uncharacterized protein EV420DRAFT_1642373 [Desarmillaria tabescens]KAK0459392.1 hypothetical protein EV420DRAFT_1642373 [Desarmillaria tabescens]
MLANPASQGQGFVHPALELRMERMLRFEQFIPHLSHKDHWSMRYRAYPEHAFLTIELAAAVYSHPCFSQNSSRPQGSVTTWTFFRHALINGAQFPVIIWFNLVQNVINEDTFGPIDATSQDLFPVILCSSVYRALAYNVPSTLPLSSPAVDFGTAVLRFQPEVVDQLLQLFSTYNRHQDHPSISIRLRVILSLTEFTLSRLSTTETEDVREAFRLIVHSLKTHVVSSALSAKETTAVFDTILAVFENGKWALSLDWACADFLCIYAYVLGISNTNTVPVERLPEAALSEPVLKELVSILIVKPIDQYGLISSFNLVCDIIGYGLREDVMAAYDVLLDMRCFEVFSRIAFYPCLVKVAGGYPENLVVACMILAVNDWESVDTERVKMDIMGLVQLRPWDPAWPICRERLQDLVESDRFFSSQCKLDVEILPLTENEIELERRNIRLAIGVLDAYFSGGSEPLSDCSAWKPLARSHARGLVNWRLSQDEQTQV